MPITLSGFCPQYLHELGDVKYVELDELTDYLQVHHREYKHKKKLPFRILVQRGIDRVFGASPDDSAECLVCVRFLTGL